MGRTMKILGISCSAQAGRLTWQAMQACLEAARSVSPELQTELLELAGQEINPCIDCGGCRELLTCSQDDWFAEQIPLLADPEIAGMIIGTPVYFGSMSGQCKLFLDRCLPFRRQGFLFRDRVGGVLAVGGSRNGGQETAIQAVHAAMLIQDMIVVGDGPPKAHFGATLWRDAAVGELDPEGLETARSLGRRVAELALRLGPPPEE